MSTPVAGRVCPGVITAAGTLAGHGPKARFSPKETRTSKNLGRAGSDGGRPLATYPCDAGSVISSAISA